MSSYRTFAEQFEHYVGRTGSVVPDAPVGGPAAWTAAELGDDQSWVHELSPREIECLELAIAAVSASGVPMEELTRDDVRLGELEPGVQRWRDQLAGGRGIVLVRGFPVRRWSAAHTELATWCLGLRLGVPGAQNPAGDLLGRVQNSVAGDRGAPRLYRTNADIRFHCDYADVVGLMCVRDAPVGGHSRVASSIAIHDEMLVRTPELARRLYEAVWLDARDEGPNPARPIRPFVHDGSRLSVFYHSDYFRSAARHGPSFAPSELLLAALDRFDELAGGERLCLEMRLEPGDLQLVSNHSVVHARSHFEDDPAAPRLLLRLWLSIDGDAG